MQSIIEILRIKASSDKNPELSKRFSLKPGVGQNIALHRLRTFGNSARRISVFPDLFFPQQTCVVNSGSYFYL